LLLIAMPIDMVVIIQNDWHNYVYYTIYLGEFDFVLSQKL